MIERMNMTDAMTIRPVTIQEHEPAPRALDMMHENEISHLPVLDGERLVGLIGGCNFRLEDHFHGLTATTAGQLMSRRFLNVPEDAPVREVVFAMFMLKLDAAIVVDKRDRITGIFTMRDAIRAVLEAIAVDFEETAKAA